MPRFAYTARDRAGHAVSADLDAPTRKDALRLLTARGLQVASVSELAAGPAGKKGAAKVAKPIDPRVPAGATRHFAIAISDPPSNARDLEVVFETAAQRAARTAVPAVPPAPVDAQPLPANSPDALPEHG